MRLVDKLSPSYGEIRLHRESNGRFRALGTSRRRAVLVGAISKVIQYQAGLKNYS